MLLLSKRVIDYKCCSHLVRLSTAADSAITVGTEVSLNGQGQIEALADGPTGKKLLQLGSRWK